MPYYLRREPSLDEAKASLARGRSLRGWAWAGNCRSCWEREWQEQREFGFRPDWEPDDLEPCPLPSLPPGKARCGCDGEPLALYLPGLCALAEFEEEPDEADALAASEPADWGWLPVVALYEGEPAGDDPDEGWTLFRPTRLVWVKEVIRQ